MKKQKRDYNYSIAPVYQERKYGRFNVDYETGEIKS